MLLKNIKIVGLRSIKATEMLGCGGLNVLIGKNNAGKSNLLSAINGFFNVFARGDILDLRPIFAQDVDYFDKDTSSPIEITCCFAISPAQTADIVSVISRDYPPVRNMVAGLSESRYLKATVKYFYTPSPFALLTTLALNSSSDLPEDSADAIVYRVTDSVAPQLEERFRQASKKKTENAAHRRVLGFLDRDVYDTARRETLAERPRPIPLRVALERFLPNLTQELGAALDQDFQQTENFEDFLAALNQRIAAGEAEVKSIQETPVSGDILTVGGHEHVVPSYVTALCKCFADEKVLYQREGREPISPGDAQRLLSVRVQKGGDRLFRAFQQTVTALIGVEIDAFEDATDVSDIRRVPRRVGGRLVPAERIAKLDVDNFLVQVNGSGIKEALRLLLDVELVKPTIMLIEEPEIHLHPGLETSIRGYLKQQSELSQIFLTTHSTNFIDSGEYSSIYFVTKEAATTATLLSAEDAADVIPQELGLRLSSLFMFDKLIFVEGASDEDVLREWSSLLHKNLAGVGFINLGGSRNVKHFAAHKTTEFLGKRGVDLWFILDRDEKRAAEVTKLEEALGARCKLRTLPVREIENYLVKPEPLARYISSRLAKGNGSVGDAHNVSVREVANAINECADELRDFTLGKDLLSRVNTPIYISPELQTNDTRDRVVSAIADCLTSGASTLNQRAGSLEDTIHELSDEADRTWSDQKLSRVPGTELLDTVLKRYGLAYRKMRDARGIAASMTADEVPEDIKRLLNEIVP